MYKLVQAFGLLAAGLGGWLIWQAVDNAAGVGMSRLVAFGSGIAIFLPGAMLYSFGLIIEHLVALRGIGERQLEIFSRLGKSDQVEKSR